MIDKRRLDEAVRRVAQLYGGVRNLQISVYISRDVFSGVAGHDSAVRSVVQEYRRLAAPPGRLR